MSSTTLPTPQLPCPKCRNMIFEGLVHFCPTAIVTNKKCNPLLINIINNLTPERE